MRLSIATVALVGLAAFGARDAHADDKGKTAEKFTLATLSYQPVWCAAELDPIGEDVCHAPGTPAADGRRTLVMFLHGVIAKNTMWQWLQERGISRIAKELHFEAIVPQAPRVGPN